MTMSSSYQGTSMQGWTCSNCGVFVPGNTSHSCRWNFGNVPPPVPVPTPALSLSLSADDIERIARRVVELLNERDANRKHE